MTVSAIYNLHLVTMKTRKWYSLGKVPKSAANAPNGREFSHWLGLHHIDMTHRQSA